MMPEDMKQEHEKKYCAHWHCRRATTPGDGGVQMTMGLKSGPAMCVTRTCSGHVTWAGVNPVLIRSSRAALNLGDSIALQLFAPYWFTQEPQVPCQLPGHGNMLTSCEASHCNTSVLNIHVILTYVYIDVCEIICTYTV